MEILVNHARFERQKLVVRTADWFSGPQLLLNGSPLKRIKGAYSAQEDDGGQMSIRLKIVFGDPVPRVRLNDEDVQIAKPLRWYEYGWAALPMVLLFVGGALGGLTGALGCYCNFRIFRSDRAGIAKLALSGVTTSLAAVMFFFLAISLRATVGR